jgi:hypothetical protein
VELAAGGSHVLIHAIFALECQFERSVERDLSFATFL